ncbi:hypothetical protein B0T14DRAFT_571097 [Immersiella caudata]|uniref:Uncharacterized protein n=1 Tax=Immersiella caudata TaxID=314043 RepID=A0AA39TSF0_9PEZI|nr:hypothetical protein B0T14DRAFT_571097 [Immersiella caudata]
MSQSISPETPAAKAGNAYTIPPVTGSPPSQDDRTVSKRMSFSSLASTPPRRAIILPEGGLNPDLLNPREAPHEPVCGLSATANEFVPRARFHPVRQLLPPTTSVAPQNTFGFSAQAKEFVPGAGSHTVVNSGRPSNAVQLDPNRPAENTSDTRSSSPTSSTDPSLPRPPDEAVGRFNAMIRSVQKKASEYVPSASSGDVAGESSSQELAPSPTKVTDSWKRLAEERIKAEIGAFRVPATETRSESTAEQPAQTTLCLVQGSLEALSWASVKSFSRLAKERERDNNSSSAPNAESSPHEGCIDGRAAVFDTLSQRGGDQASDSGVSMGGSPEAPDDDRRDPRMDPM